ncbi:hypothetical protein LPJ53_002400 [Coemansia erecta]|uniref:Chitin-binding type-4 domain-containing protein n=1 Tax=Coemansia erecta TaxID=147472 RepID=A0A9W8CR75_9FUNG|nr:hypothetical protein LPJ53_002400 [Coemansia erecta]
MYSKIINALALAGVSLAHMAIISPCPRYSPQGIDCPALPSGQSLDYSMTSPLGETEPLCKHTVPFPTPCAKWTAGQQVTVQFAQGGAPHGGGHCQYSLSYDGGKTFVVVYEVLEHCFGADNSQRDFTFTLPSGLPSSDNAVFAWTWVNAVGNREFYMNCADVSISGTSNSYTGKQMVIANHAGYPTIPEFDGNYATGLDLYQNATSITVTGSGSTSGSSGNNSDSGSGNASSSYVSSDSGSGSSSSSYVSSDSGSGSGSTSSSYISSQAATDSPQTSDNSPVAHDPQTSSPSYSTTPTAEGTSSATPSTPASSAPTTPLNSAYSTETVAPLSTQPASSSASEQSDAPVYTSANAPVTTTSGPVYPTSEPPLTDTPASTVGACTGTMQCSSDGSGFQYCLYGQWTSTVACPQGTKCKQQSDSILCDWP